MARTSGATGHLHVYVVRCIGVVLGVALISTGLQHWRLVAQALDHLPDRYLPKLRESRFLADYDPNRICWHTLYNGTGSRRLKSDQKLVYLCYTPIDLSRSGHLSQGQLRITSANFDTGQNGKMVRSAIIQKVA